MTFAHRACAVKRSRDVDAPALETTFADLCVARDPMLVRFGATWVMYYTRCGAELRESGVAYRTSQDLSRWSEPAMALVLPNAAMFNSGYTESPFVFERDGWFYLSVTSYPIEWNATQVFRSRSPFAFAPKPIARLTSHAGEWVFEPATEQQPSESGSPRGAGQLGLWMMPVEFGR